jgi:hypothetical protein
MTIRLHLFKANEIDLRDVEIAIDMPFPAEQRSYASADYEEHAKAFFRSQDALAWVRAQP